jgi:hypothetical protein
MLHLPLYNKKELRLAFEFALVLSDVATKMKVELTKELSIKAQEMLINELRTRGFKKTSKEFIPLIMASLEVK